jgi:ribosome-associated protein
MTTRRYLKITQHIEIPIDELEFRFSRSSGPGGQNVNRLETKVELRFDILRSPSLGEEDQRLLLERLKGRIGKDGCVRITAQDSRSQWKNKELAIDRFITLLDKHLKRTTPRTATKPTYSSREQRLTGKKNISRKKDSRRKKYNTDE